MRYKARPRPIPGKMNKLETEYSKHLKMLQMAGEVISFQFESIKFKLAKATFYNPDFIVVTNDQIEVHEVKGFWEDDARVKIKVAAEMFPYIQFKAIQKKKGKWVIEEF